MEKKYYCQDPRLCGCKSPSISGLHSSECRPMHATREIEKPESRYRGSRYDGHVRGFRTSKYASTAT